jgi:predicted RNA-binding protein
MAVKFISHVEENNLGNWFITLTDTLQNKSTVCMDMDQYKKNLEKLADEYGNDIEVVWTKSKTLSPQNYQDLNEKMAELQKEYAQEIEELNQNKEDNTGFNPNA